MRLPVWVGSWQSLILHTLFFIGTLLLALFGTSLEVVLLVLTTLVSLEAIYLAIIIQMSVNEQSKHLKNVSEDVEDILEDTEELTED